MRCKFFLDSGAEICINYIAMEGRGGRAPAIGRLDMARTGNPNSIGLAPGGIQIRFEPKHDRPAIPGRGATGALLRLMAREGGATLAECREAVRSPQTDYGLDGTRSAWITPSYIGVKGYGILFVQDVDDSGAPELRVMSFTTENRTERMQEAERLADAIRKRAGLGGQPANKPKNKGKSK